MPVLLSVARTATVKALIDAGVWGANGHNFKQVWPLLALFAWPFHSHVQSGQVFGADWILIMQIMIDHDRSGSFASNVSIELSLKIFRMPTGLCPLLLEVGLPPVLLSRLRESHLTSPTKPPGRSWHRMRPTARPATERNVGSFEL